MMVEKRSGVGRGLRGLAAALLFSLVLAACGGGTGGTGGTGQEGAQGGSGAAATAAPATGATAEPGAGLQGEATAATGAADATTEAGQGLLGEATTGTTAGEATVATGAAGVTAETGAAEATATGADAGMATAEATTAAEEAADTAAAGPVEIGTIAGDVESFQGQVVTVTGQIGGLVGETTEQTTPQAFVLEGGGLVDGGVVVLARDESAFANTQADWFGDNQDQVEVLISGEVQPFAREQLAQDFNLILPEEAFADFEGQPAIIAERVYRVVEAGDLTGGDAQYEGQTVAVRGSKGESLNPRVFRLGDDLLVVNTVGLQQGSSGGAAGGGTAQQGATAATTSEAGATGTTTATTGTDVEAGSVGNTGQDLWVIGTVQPFVAADLEQQYGLQLQEEQLADAEGQQVVVATALLPVDPQQ